MTDKTCGALKTLTKCDKLTMNGIAGLTLKVQINLSISCHWMFPSSAGLFSCLKYKWPHWSQPHMVGLHYNSTRRSHMPPSFSASHLNTHTRATLPQTFAHYHIHTFVCLIYTIYRCLPCMLIRENPAAVCASSIWLMKSISTVWFQVVKGNSCSR